MDPDKIAAIIRAKTHKVEYGPQELVDVCPVSSLINALADEFEAEAVEQCLNLICEDCAGLDPEKRHEPGTPFDRAEFLSIAKGKSDGNHR